ncbi:MAG: GNAT family N-acetyltransferase [Alphaproteobacteria bacterium]|nr:GNAT family N-acetyltransferase [Alphaproteobacteria bacterium]
MIAIRRARPQDAEAIASAHVAAWRSAYAGILPDFYLAGMSERRQARQWRHALEWPRQGAAVFVAVASGEDLPPDAPADGFLPPGSDPSAAEPPGAVVGYASAGRLRRSPLGLARLGEIETLYVLDDYRERGLGRRLMRAAAAHLNAVGCDAALLWVLCANQARFFYRHLGGAAVAEQEITVGGAPVTQQAMLWDPISVLLAATQPSTDR